VAVLSQFVLDCSVSISWCLTDELSPYANQVLDLLSQTEAIVPMIWHLEMANTFLVSERRGRITVTQSAEAIAFLEALPIEMDMETVAQAWERSLSLGRHYHLAVYDAVYLELAIRRKLPLATIDNRLMESARDCGVFLENPIFESIVGFKSGQ
jgi:predicted nucleic acid-binding protein